MSSQCQCTSIQTLVKLTVGCSLLLLSLFCQQSLSTFEYSPKNVKPLFDLMRKYGAEKKNESSGGRQVKQYLVVLMASNDEMQKPPVNLKDVNLTGHMEEHFRDRLIFLLNEKHTNPHFNPRRKLHGEVNFIDNKMIEPMNIAFRKKYPGQSPVVLMYSYYIPCADIQDLGYSCSEETAIFAIHNWMNFDLLVAYSTIYNGTSRSVGTNAANAKEFLQLAGIPAFQYQGKALVPAYSVASADKEKKVHSVTFLHVLFECLVMSIKDGCMPDSEEDRKAIIALFVNQIAYECFKDFNNTQFAWREKNRENITECFVARSKAKVGSSCKLCRGTCMDSKKNVSENCVWASFDKSLVPGEPADPSDPFNDTWKVTTDPTIRFNTIFRESPEIRVTAVGREVSCKDKNFSLPSLCTVYKISKGSKSTLSRQGSPPLSHHDGETSVPRLDKVAAMRHPNTQKSSRSAI